MFQVSLSRRYSLLLLLIFFSCRLLRRCLRLLVSLGLILNSLIIISICKSPDLFFEPLEESKLPLRMFELLDLQNVHV